MTYNILYVYEHFLTNYLHLVTAWILNMNWFSGQEAVLTSSKSKIIHCD